MAGVEKLVAHLIAVGISDVAMATIYAEGLVSEGCDSIELLEELEQSELVSDYGFKKFHARQVAKAALRKSVPKGQTPPEGVPPPARVGSLELPMGSVELKTTEIIGRGASGIVCRATLKLESGGSEEVAAKILAPGASAREHEKFQKEFEISVHAAQRCAGACRIYGCVRHENALCIVMKLYKHDFVHLLDTYRCPSASVDQTGTATLVRGTSKRLALDLPEAIEYGMQIARALAELHAAKVIVQDLKPGNILCDAEDQLVIADFGISALTESTITSVASKSGFGTPSYMAPEQVDRELGKVSSATDIWAWACIMVEMLTGLNPWFGLRQNQIICEIAVKGNPPPLPDTLHIDVASLLRRCFFKDSKMRPTASEVVDALRSIVVDARPAAPLDPNRPTSKIERGPGTEAWGHANSLLTSTWFKRDAHIFQELLAVHEIDNPRLQCRYDAWKAQMPPEIVNANELHLFHGCSTEALESIVERGFLREFWKSSSGDWQRFGPGFYFALQASKAHEYPLATISKLPIGEHQRQILLCKVAQGKVFQTHDNIEGLAGSAPAGFHSVHGLASASGALNYDELVVYDESAVLPYALVTYKFSKVATSAVAATEQVQPPNSQALESQTVSSVEEFLAAASAKFTAQKDEILSYSSADHADLMKELGVGVVLRNRLLPEVPAAVTKRLCELAEDPDYGNVALALKTFTRCASDPSFSAAFARLKSHEESLLAQGEKELLGVCNSTSVVPAAIMATVAKFQPYGDALATQRAQAQARAAQLTVQARDDMDAILRSTQLDGHKCPKGSLSKLHAAAAKYKAGYQHDDAVQDLLTKLELQKNAVVAATVERVNTTRETEDIKAIRLVLAELAPDKQFVEAEYSGLDEHWQTLQLKMRQNLERMLTSSSVSDIEAAIRDAAPYGDSIEEQCTKVVEHLDTLLEKNGGAPARVVLVATDFSDHLADMKKHLERGLGRSVPVFNLTHDGKLTVQVLKPFNVAVLVTASWNRRMAGYEDTSYDNKAAGDALADWVDDGHNVVQMYTNGPPTGRWEREQFNAMTHDGVDESGRQRGGFGKLDFTDDDSAFIVGPLWYNTGKPTPGASVVSRWGGAKTAGAPFVTVARRDVSCVLSLNFYPPSSACTAHGVADRLWDPVKCDAGKCMANAVRVCQTLSAQWREERDNPGKLPKGVDPRKVACFWYLAKQQLIAAISRVGVDTFNRGDHDECYKVYRDAALHVLAQLGVKLERTEPAKVLSDAVVKAASEDLSTDSAWTMRGALDEVIELSQRMITELPGPQLTTDDLRMGRASTAEIARDIKQAISAGVPLWNAGDYAGCAECYKKCGRRHAAAEPRLAAALRDCEGRVAGSSARDSQGWTMRNAFDKILSSPGSEKKRVTSAVQADSELPTGTVVWVEKHGLGAIEGFEHMPGARNNRHSIRFRDGGVTTLQLRGLQWLAFFGIPSPV